MDSVEVALRIRPLVKTEIDIGCRTCVERIPNEPQVTIGKENQMFTYNYVFDELEGQGKVYDVAVKSLIDNLFKGYNVTILAYGQTGSGKTYSMGTNYSGEGELGIIPRAVYDIFNRINGDVGNEFKVTVTFIELYNESLYDLLTQKSREQSVIEMREMSSGVCIPGLTEWLVNSPIETLNKLKEVMWNNKIYINIKTDNVVNSKFHLVDLAGSERSKKTGTTGNRFKEGVNINKGLLVLGNVISLLGEGTHSYINYRDSKLTRLLQDSLGGNSVTLMIACISPADYNQDETLSTLRYADRARKIKNKPIVNQDPRLSEIIRLRKENEELRLKMIGGILHCPPEHKTLLEENMVAKRKINELSKALGSALTQNTTMFEKTLSIIVFMKFASEKIKNREGWMAETFRVQTQELERLQNFRDRIEELEKKNSKLCCEIKNKNLEMSNVPSSIKECESSVLDKCPIDDYDPAWRQGTPVHELIKVFKQNLRKRFSPQIEKILCNGSCKNDCVCLKPILTCSDKCSCDHTPCITTPKRLKESSHVDFICCDGVSFVTERSLMVFKILFTVLIILRLLYRAVDCNNETQPLRKVFSEHFDIFE